MRGPLSFELLKRTSLAGLVERMIAQATDIRTDQDRLLFRERILQRIFKYFDASPYHTERETLVQSINNKSREGETLLYIALKESQLALAISLLKHGAVPDAEVETHNDYYGLLATMSEPPDPRQLPHWKQICCWFDLWALTTNKCKHNPTFSITLSCETSVSSTGTITYPSLVSELLDYRILPFLGEQAVGNSSRIWIHITVTNVSRKTIFVVSR